MRNKWIIGIIAVVVLAGGLFLLSRSPSPSSTPESPTSTPEVAVEAATNEQNIITLTQRGFSPMVTTIKAGATVTWENKSGKVATINSDPHPAHTNYPPLNLDNFSDGGSLNLTFGKPGTYGYHNHLNPSMTGVIIVE